MCIGDLWSLPILGKMKMNKLDKDKEWSYLRLPYSLIHSGLPDSLRRYYQKLCEFKFLLKKIQRPEFGVQALIEDYDWLDTPETTKHSGCDPETVEALRSIQRTLQLCADQLAKEPTELALHLWDKLQRSELPEIKDLLRQIMQSQTVWLRSLEPSLPHPGERLLYTLSGHGSLVNVIAISSDGKHAVSGSEDGKLQVWDLKTREAASPRTHHEKSVTAIAITPDNKQVISGSADGTLKVWKFVKQRNSKEKEIVTLQELSTLTEEKEKYAITTLAITSEGNDGKWVTIVGREANTWQNLWGLLGKRHRVIKWDLQDLEEKKKVLSKGFVADAITLIPDGTKAILGSTEIISSRSDNQEYIVLKIKSLLPKNDSQRVFNIIKAFNLIKFYRIRIDKLFFRRNLTVFAIDPNEKYAIFSVEGGKDLVVCNLDRGHQFTLTGHDEEVTAVAITPDGKQAISCSKDRTLKIWSLETAQELLTLTGHTNLVNSVTIAPNGKQAISCSKDGTLNVWNLENLEGS